MQARYVGIRGGQRDPVAPTSLIGRVRELAVALVRCRRSDPDSEFSNLPALSTTARTLTLAAITKLSAWNGPG